MYRNTLKDIMMSYLHIPYIWGGESPSVGFDCGGLVIDILQTVGELPNRYDNTSQGLYNHFSKVANSTGIGLGALCFYGKSKNRIIHVAMMIDDSSILEAGGGNSTTKTVVDAIKKDARVRIRQYNFRKDLVAIIMPKYSNITRYAGE